MPYINKPQKKFTLGKITSQKHGKSADIYALYNTRLWQKLRASHLMMHPLCERCEERGLAVPACEVHHITPISTADSDADMRALAYNPANLMALCEKCHHDLHNAMRQTRRENS